jgi:hypothetical protein
MFFEKTCRVRRILVLRFSKRTTAVWVGMVAGTVLLMIAMALVSGQRSAGAQSVEDVTTGPTLQFGCDVVEFTLEDGSTTKVRPIDPIVDPEPGHAHDHVFYGNTGVDADSTYETLVKNTDTTCSHTFATSSYWNPVVKDGETEVNEPNRLSIYYTGSSDQTKVQPIPDGLQLIGKGENGKVDYRCGQDAPVSSPPYGCTAQQFRIRVHFPECWDRSSLAPDSLVDMSRGECPSSHPYQIPTIRMAVHYDNVGGILNGPLMVSAGDGEFLGAGFFHADVFDAPQQPAFDDTIRKCVNNVADGATPPAVCRPSLRPETTLASSGPSGTVASNSATFAFSTPEPDATFQCSLDNAAFTNCNPAPNTATSKSYSGLEPGTHTFAVRAVEPFSGQVDLTPASRTWTVDPDATTVIAAPSNLTATPGGSAKKPQVSLTWTDNSTGEVKFVIERSTQAGFTTNLVTYEVGANATSYVDTALKQKTTYYYRVLAVDQVGTRSAPSNVASTTTR